MTDQDLEDIFRIQSGNSRIAALRAIYQLGFTEGMRSAAPQAAEPEQPKVSRKKPAKRRSSR